jgi:hypothetical protein
MPQTIDRAYSSSATPTVAHALVRCEVGLVEAFSLHQPVSWTTGSGIVRDVIDPGGPPQGTVFLQMVSGTAPTPGTFITANSIPVNANSVPRSPQLTSEVQVGSLASFRESNATRYVASVVSATAVELTDDAPVLDQAFTMVLGSAATPFLGIPVPEPGDHNPLGTLSAGIVRLDEILSAARRKSVSIFHRDPVNGLILIAPRLSAPWKAVRVTHKLQAGSCTVQFRTGSTGSTNVTNTINIGTTLGSSTNVLDGVGQEVWLNLSSVSATAADLALTLEVDLEV